MSVSVSRYSASMIHVCKGNMKFGEKQEPEFQKAHVPPSKSMHFREFNVLFYPTIIRRSGRAPITGIVAAEMLAVFGDISQEN